MPVRQLPPSPNLDHLKYQAQDLRRAHRARAREAAQRLREFHPRFAGANDDEIFAAKLALSDAQLAIAREYGFASWPRLKKHVQTGGVTGAFERPYHDRITDAVFRRAVDLIDAGDAKALRSLLQQHPRLVHQRVEFDGGNYFRNPSLLEFVAENPVRHGSLPGNIVEVAQAILDAGPDSESKDETLMLVATGRIAREYKRQRPLIALLAQHGADVNRAVEAAALHGELEAVHTLLAEGAVLTLPVAAALGNTNEAQRFLGSAGSHERHVALTMAALHGHAAIARMLLEAGEDPNRYNPVGAHSHSTPLHQAALAGHMDVVKVLVERGAELDARDILWHGTPADWAAHAKQTEIEQYLRKRMAERETSR